MSEKFAIVTTGIVLLALIGLGVTGAALGGSFPVNVQTRVCTVSETESVNTEEGHEYRVYTENCGTMVNRDALFAGKFNSADVQGALEDGETYEITTWGYRLGFLSMFPNIVEYEVLDES
jgi:hypothetical protein